MSWKAQPVSKYDDPYQATSDKELKSEVIFGMAVAIIDRSCSIIMLVRSLKYRENDEPGGKKICLTRPVHNIERKSPVNTDNNVQPVGYSASSFVLLFFSRLLSMAARSGISIVPGVVISLARGLYE